ncbi:zinc-binding dehydrogenase [Paraburkholderia silviterrae]|uniref:Zinc-binding dehydrogenase n=1 Tax=Paraburkholderia silviterrae TaxID=2528715 RepID=A0A4R5LXN1_9BURK|nr:zinc-binding dehydrogenase [Paraburkholderia silviterrae]TDG16728.1 hypothetical protein EYW47_39870 [Paraburkholderia silviterrae]
MGAAVIDAGTVTPEIGEVSPGGVDKVLELLGTTTLKDSLRCAKPGGVVCMTGIVGNQWAFENFGPMEVIPSTVRLTIHDGGVGEFMVTPYNELLDQVTSGTFRIPVAKVIRLADIVEAHRCMDENRAGGKIVVLP